MRVSGAERKADGIADARKVEEARGGSCSVGKQVAREELFLTRKETHELKGYYVPGHVFYFHAL